MAKYESESVDRLMQAITLIETPKECRAFFDDLCTIKELQNLATRLDAAVMISEGVNYLEISKKIGASSTTISRVSRCYNFGDDGYKSMIEKLKKQGMLHEDR